MSEGSEGSEDEWSSTPNGPTQALNAMKAGSKVGIAKKEPLSTVVEDYYL